VAKKDKKKAKQRAEEVVVAAPIPREVADDLAGGGAGLCYGEPVREGARTVIPVARVGGSRDAVGAQPVGYIEVGAEGARFVAIGDAARDRVLMALAAVAATLAGALAGVLLGRRRR
jgi:hypothetical protein